MLSLAELVTPQALPQWIDPETARRGEEYLRSGQVERTRVEADGPYSVEVRGWVRGSRTYRTHVSVTELTGALRRRAGGWPYEITPRCTCPVGWACKHAVATLLSAAQDQAPDAPGSWRRSLDVLVDDVEQAVTAPAVEQTPVALMITWTRPHHGYPVVRAHPRLAVRLSRRGRSGRWVKSGFTWRELVAVEHDPTTRYDPRHVQLLRELQVALQGTNPYWSPGSETLDLHTAAPALWPLLERAAAAGIPLLCSEPQTTVRRADSPATLQLDLSRAGDGVAVRAGAVSEGAWYEPGDVAFIGEPAHGVVLWGGDATTRSIVLAPLTRTLPRAVRSHFVQQAPLVVPGADVPELVGEYLPRLAHVVGVGSRDGSVPLPGPTRVRLRGQVTWHEDASAVLAWRWVHSSDEGPERDLPVDDPTVGRLLRDPAREQQVVGLLEADETVAALLGVGQHGPGTLAAELRFRGLDALGFATDVLPRLEDVARRSDGSVELVLVGRTPDFRPATGVPEVRFTSSEGDHREGRTDWLELEVVVAIRDEELGTVQIGLAQVLAALASGSTTVMVRDHVYVDLDRPELDRLARLVADARAMVDQPPRGIRLSRDHHDLLADLAGLVEAGPSDGRVREWTRAAAALRELPATEPPAEPAGLQATLRPYQRAGYAWMSFLHEHGLGGVLADDMGLGKTVQTLAMVARARESDPQAPPFLVVAPASVVSTWVAEAARFTPGLRVVAITESAARRGWGLDRLAERSPDVVVTTYTLLRLEAAGYAGLRWAGLVLDEAQSVKNHTSKTYDAARRVEAGSRFAITGTPMENNLMELWSILSLTAPGLFPHAADFRERFAKPIEQDASPDALAVLRRRIGPVVLRRTKDLVASDLPAKQEQVLTVELGPRHRKLYDTHLQRERQRVLKLLEDLDENRISILASLTRLRQLSLDPALVDPEHEKVGSAKIDLLVEHLSEIAAEGHRALVFSQFTSFLSRVARRLTAAGLGYSYLDGSTRRRGEVVDGFRSGTDPVFLISLKAGGVGLTLTEADYCFLLDPWWNPAVEAQAVDRAHRIGQTRNVVVYRLVSAGTVEEKVMELARRKAALFASVVGADSLASTSLTADDIAALLEP